MDSILWSIPKDIRLVIYRYSRNIAAIRRCCKALIVDTTNIVIELSTLPITVHEMVVWGSMPNNIVRLTTVRLNVPRAGNLLVEEIRINGNGSTYTITHTSWLHTPPNYDITPSSKSTPIANTLEHALSLVIPLMEQLDYSVMFHIYSNRLSCANLIPKYAHTRMRQHIPLWSSIPRTALSVAKYMHTGNLYKFLRCVDAPTALSYLGVEAAIAWYYGGSTNTLSELYALVDKYMAALDAYLA